MAVEYQNKFEDNTYAGTTFPMSAPDGFSAGDLFIAIVTKDDDPAITIPEGWTIIQEGAGADPQCYFSVAYRIAEVGDTTWNWTGDNETWYGVILRYTGQAESGFIHASGKADGDSATPTAPSVDFTDLEEGSIAIQCFGQDGNRVPYDEAEYIIERYIGGVSGSGGCGGIGGEKAREIDSYDKSNQTVYRGINNITIKISQSFTATADTLEFVKFYIQSIGSPTGNVVAKLYAHSGTYGSSSVPTGEPLAISDNVDLSTIPDTLALITFTFTGANKYSLSNGTKYCITIESDDCDAIDKIRIGQDSTSPTHSGNPAYYEVSWTADDTRDFIFYILSVDVVISGSGSTGTAIFTTDGADEWLAVTVVIEAAIEEEAIQLSVIDDLTLGDTRIEQMTASLSRIDGLISGDIRVETMTAELLRTDGLKPGDSRNSLSDMPVSVTSGITLNDVNSLLKMILVSDDLELSDSRIVSMLSNLLRADNVELSALENIISSINRTDGLNLSDSRVLSMLAALIRTDNVKLGDNALEIIIANLLRTDGLELDDSRLASMLAELSRVDGLTLVDTALLVKVILLLASDSLELSDNRVISMLSNLLRIDNTEFGDSVLEYIVANISRDDGLKLSDTTLISMLAELLASDDIELSDEAIVEIIGQIFLSILDGLKIGDVKIISMLSNLIKTDNIELNALEYIISIINRSDGLTLADTTLLIKTALLLVSDDLKLSDNRIVSILSNLLRTDNVKLNDSSIANMLSYLIKTDNVKLGDNIVINILLYLIKTDGVKLTDSSMISMLSYLIRQDTIDISDEAMMELIGEIFLAIIDSIKLGDNRVANMIAELIRVDDIKFSEILTIGMYGIRFIFRVIKDRMFRAIEGRLAFKVKKGIREFKKKGINGDFKRYK